MSFKVHGDGKIKSHIVKKNKVNASTGEKEKIVVETEIKKEPSKTSK